MSQKLNSFFSLLREDEEEEDKCTLREETEETLLFSEDKSPNNYSEFYDPNCPEDPYHEQEEDGTPKDLEKFYCFESDPVTLKCKFAYETRTGKEVTFFAYHNLFVTEPLGENGVCIVALREEPPEENLFIPKRLNEKTVVALGTNFLGEYANKVKGVFIDGIQFLKAKCFAKSGVELVMGQECTTIGNSCFEGCIHLKSVEGMEVKVIGDSAFKGCMSLKFINLQFAMSIGKSAFENCLSLESVQLSNTLRELKLKSFAKCTSIKSVVLGSSLRGVDCRCFENCYRLESVKFAPTLKDSSYKEYRIGADCFKNCQSLVNISIPKYVVGIDSRAFKNCTELRGANLGEVKTLGARVFEGCSLLKRIKVPKSVSFVGEKCFASSGLQQVKFECVRLKSLKYTFENCSQLYEVSMPKVVDSLEGCFVNCRILGEVELPEESSKLGYCFQGCSELEKIKIPFTVKVLTKGTFRSCKSLRKVCIPKTVTKVSKSAFSGVKGCVLVVVRGSEGERFAQKNSFDYQYLGESRVIKAQKNPTAQKLKTLGVKALGKLRSLVKDGNQGESKQAYLTFKF